MSQRKYPQQGSIRLDIITPDHITDQTNYHCHLFVTMVTVTSPLYQLLVRIYCYLELFGLILYLIPYQYNNRVLK